MKPLKINRTNDAVFKNIFANKKHKAITIDFINSVFFEKDKSRGIGGDCYE